MVAASRKSQTSVQAAVNAFVLQRQTQNNEYFSILREEIRLIREQTQLDREKMSKEFELRQENMAMVLFLLKTQGDNLNSLEQILNKQNKEK